MHNLISRAQLEEWRHVDDVEIEDQKINHYYECLIECDALREAQCKRICRRILM